ncbi:MAG TPA: hypothetical protein VK621_16725 [Bradyrhizobium sp.]|jgi:hypothetical protein|nr:hypothetical protein [Bradyrhizobium sp.]
MLLDTDKIDDAALALFYLTLHDGVAVGRVRRSRNPPSRWMH